MVNFWCNQIIDPKTNEYVTVLQIVGKIQELSFINRKTFVLLKSYLQINGKFDMRSTQTFANLSRLNGLMWNDLRQSFTKI